MKNEIYYLGHKDLLNKHILFNFIYQNKKLNYYYSDDFSEEFYIQLAYSGFISVSDKINGKYILFPEMQFEYAVLYFNNLHISKKVKKLLNKNETYRFKVDENFYEVLKKIIAAHENPWLEGEYEKMLKNIYEKHNDSKDFRLLSFELYDTQSSSLIAGEIGYIIGKTYTSLTGFKEKGKKYNNYGKLQLTLLAQYLKKNDFAFWNLGHPYMQYKIDLGAEVLSREEFLKIWFAHRQS